MGINNRSKRNCDLLAAAQAYHRSVQKTPTHPKHKLIITAFFSNRSGVLVVVLLLDDELGY
jgi:hypothetical protein